MLYIHFNNKVPNEKKFEYAVQGNNKVDVITFDITNITELDFEPTHSYVKVQTKDKSYVDKIELTNNGGGILTWNLLAKTTAHRIIECQLSFETSEQTYQTEMFELTLKPHINADEEIENDYPTVLQSLQDQIDELAKKEGGGSGDVIIEKVWLTYDDKKSLVANHLATKVDEQNFTNDSTRIWVNFKTSPIGVAVENEIKKGRFIIRLDYPIINHKHFPVSSLIAHQPQGNYGFGHKSFVNTFVGGNSGNLKQEKKEILLNSFIFVNESDIKTNDYGEKYIHKKISFFDYVNKICRCDTPLSPLTNDELNNTEYGRDFFNDYLNDKFAIGIPATIQTGSVFDNGETSRVFAGWTKLKIYNTRNGFSEIEQKGAYNVKKLNPAFSCYCLMDTDVREVKNIFSPYFATRNKITNYYKFELTYVLGRETDGGIDYETKPRSKYLYMSAKPRCCVLNDNYETSEKAFIKKYPQAEQNIRVYCKNMLYIDDYEYGIMPIFRMLITQK